MEFDLGHIPRSHSKLHSILTPFRIYMINVVSIPGAFLIFDPDMEAVARNDRDVTGFIEAHGPFFRSRRSPSLFSEDHETDIVFTSIATDHAVFQLRPFHPKDSILICESDMYSMAYGGLQIGYRSK